MTRVEAALAPKWRVAVNWAKARDLNGRLYGLAEIVRFKFGDTVGMKMCQAPDCFQFTHFRWPVVKDVAYCGWNCYLRHR